MCITVFCGTGQLLCCILTIHAIVTHIMDSEAALLRVLNSRRTNICHMHRTSSTDQWWHYLNASTDLDPASIPSLNIDSVPKGPEEPDVASNPDPDTPRTMPLTENIQPYDPEVC